MSTIYRLLHECVKEGDGVSCFLILKFLLHIFHRHNRKNYTQAIFRFISNVYTKNLPSESYRLLHNRFCNISGGKGRCIPKDMAMENKIRFIKKSLRGFGRNVNKSTITRLNNSSDMVEREINNLISSLGMKKRAKKRTKKDLEHDFNKITSKLKKIKYFKLSSWKAIWII